MQRLVDRCSGQEVVCGDAITGAIAKLSRRNSMLNTYVAPHMNTSVADPERGIEGATRCHTIFIGGRRAVGSRWALEDAKSGARPVIRDDDLSLNIATTPLL